MSRTRRIIMVIGGIALIGVMAVPVIHHLRGARFETTVVPVGTLDGCVASTEAEWRQIGGQANALEMCQSGDPGIWMRVSVRNVGDRSAWVNTCDLRALDRAGRATLSGTVRTRGLTFPAGPHLDPGEGVFFVSPIFDERGGSLLGPPPSTASYAVTCPPIDYHGDVPA